MRIETERLIITEFDLSMAERVMEKCGFWKEYEGMGLYQGESRQIVKIFL